MNQKLIYQMRDLHFEYQLGLERVQALRGINLDIYSGELLLLIGPSGSGKSTLLNLLGMIEPPQVGQLKFDGTSVASFSESDRNHIRRHHLGFIFQSFLLFDVLTAHENVDYFLVRQKLSRKERMARVALALEAVGLSHKGSNYPTQLSGGERQRVAIARALAKEPKVILADEPTASLDQKTARDILEILKKLTETGTTVIMASHDMLSLEFATRRLGLKDGYLIE